MAANDNVNECAGGLTFLDLFAAAFGKDASNKKYLRLYKTTAVAGSKAFNCGGNAADLESELLNTFTLDSNGDIAIRVSITP